MEDEAEAYQTNVGVIGAWMFIAFLLFLAGRVLMYGPPLSLQTPTQTVPTAIVTLDETPLDETPLDETPLDETPLDETPLDETPLDETPLDETPLDADGPTADAQPLPATLPAGAIPGDLSLTIYQGWPWRYAGRSGDGQHCMLEVWPHGRTAREQVWINCVLLSL